MSKIEVPGTYRARPRTWMAIAAWLGAACVGMVLAGCRDRTADFTPEPVVAENAVDRALRAWQAGEPAGKIADSKPAVFVTDSNRKPQQQLAGFKILGETRSQSGRTYAVELDLKNPAERLKTEYIVVGIDPLWVFRREDYQLLMHWDHHMPASADEKSPSDPRQEAPQ